jgi:high affinity sulfate transporter 1
MAARTTSHAIVAPQPPRGVVERFLPGLARLHEGQPLRADLVAGVTLAAYLMPAALGDASLANLPPEAGLYACLFSGLVFWLFCSSRHTSITVTSAISLLVGASLGEIAGGDVTRFGALAACTALLVGAVAFVAWLIRAGVVVSFISESVMVGFKCGVALFLASTQLPKLCGFKGSHGDFWERSHHFISHIGDTHPTSLALGLIALAVLLWGKRFLKNQPVSLFVVVAGIVATWALHLSSRGVSVLGEVPQGLPRLGLPAVNASDTKTLLPLAMAAFLVGMVETAAIGRMFATKHNYRFDANQELLGVAAANIMAGLGRGLPVSGGMSQSLVNESGGARTSLSGLFAALLILLVVIFLSDALHNLPQPVLAAVVLVAVTGLFKWSVLKHLWHADRAEFAVAIAAMLGVLGAGLLQGVLIGVILSLLQILRRASRPNVAFLGRIPGTRRFSDFARSPDNERVPGVLIFRVESSLLYFNSDYVREAVIKRAAEAGPELRVVVCDLSNAPYLDLGGAEMLAGLHDELASAEIGLKLVEAHSSVRERLHAEGLDRKVGRVDRFKSVADAVDDYLASGGNPSPGAPK